MPKPEIYQEGNRGNIGMIFFGTTTYAAVEAMDIMSDKGIIIDSMRVTAFPFGKEVEDFVNYYDQLIVVEQNRDAQFRSLLILELEINPKKIKSVLNYDGIPITAHQIVAGIEKEISVNALSN